MKTKQITLLFNVDGRFLKVDVKLRDNYGNELSTPTATVNFDNRVFTPEQVVITKES